MRNQATIPLLLLLLVAIIIGVAIPFSPFSQKQKKPAPQSELGLSDLGTKPDWRALDASQETISRTDFERELRDVYNVGDTWEDFIAITDKAAFIKTGDPNLRYELQFKNADAPTKSPTRFWKPVADLPPASDDQPLDGVHIALDPGHIGGDFAKMEERWFQIGDEKPVMEGEMSLTVAKLIEKRLTNLGAKVSLVRKKNAPVTKERAEEFLQLSQQRAASPNEAQKLAERLFYRTAEIRERARLVNEELKPDLVICLHFNAVSWGDPAQPTLSDENHLHILIHGALTSDEIAHEDERFEMIQKIVQRIHPQEKDVAAAIAKSFVDASGLPPYTYEPNSLRARGFNDQPYLWARNLIANRLYQCPVVFMEPYVMNSNQTYKRIQLGDYEGEQVIDGLPRKSIFREYADAVSDGIIEYYKKNR